MGYVLSGLVKWLVANKQLQGGITNTRWPLTQHMEGGTGSSLQSWSLGSWTAQVDWKSREAVNILGIGTHLGNNVVPKSVVITQSPWGARSIGVCGHSRGQQVGDAGIARELRGWVCTHTRGVRRIL